MDPVASQTPYIYIYIYICIFIYIHVYQLWIFRQAPHPLARGKMQGGAKNLKEEFNAPLKIHDSITPRLSCIQHALYHCFYCSLNLLNKNENELIFEVGKVHKGGGACSRTRYSESMEEGAFSLEIDIQNYSKGHRQFKARLRHIHLYIYIYICAGAEETGMTNRLGSEAYLARIPTAYFCRSDPLQ